MKRIFLSMFVFALAFSTLRAQDAPTAQETPKVQETQTVQDDDVPERLKYYKEKYEETIEASFEIVWAAIKENIAAIGANIAQQKTSQNDEGLWKGVIRSDNYVFTEGKDSTYRILQKYQYDMKYIPGGIWVNGRINYKIILKEVKNNLVELTLTSEMSAREEYVTDQFHYWKSNGMLEKQFLDALKERIKNKLKK